MIQKYLVLFCVFSLFSSVTFAATDTFRLQILVGTDTEPPTTPTLQTAIPVAQTQIDLSWTVATDNVLLSGYQVFRDASQIATTTLTTYSDSGLLASTSYSYFIRAFDSSFNISSSSNTLATTTFASVSTTTATTSNGGGSRDLDLVSFSITPGMYSAQLTWKTSRFARFELQWGRTSSFEQGFVTNEIYKKDHTTRIDDLQAGTTYEFELVGYDKDNHKTLLKRGQFTTLDAPDTEAPTNVANLKAIVTNQDVLLTWDNPQDKDFSHVRIVRSFLFYPTDSQDGFIAYVGSNNSFYDSTAFADVGTQYYTVFTYDKQGNISSGAVVKASPVATDTSTEKEAEATTTIPFILSFESIEFLQNKKRIEADTLNTQLPLLVRIPYELLPEHLKTILVTFVHPKDNNLSFSFLLKVNKDKSYYEASIAPLRVAGFYPVEVIVYDYQVQKMWSVRGMLEAKHLPIAKEVQEKELPFEFKTVLVLGMLFMLALLVVLALIVFLVRQKKYRL